jgi:hypothetical protein
VTSTPSATGPGRDGAASPRFPWWYLDTNVPMYHYWPMSIPVERVQTGLRMEKRTLKVLKALAEYLDLSLGDLLEGIVLHAFEGQAPFGAQSLAQIARLKQVYGLALTASDSHVLVETSSGNTASPKRHEASRETGTIRPARRTKAGRR